MTIDILYLGVNMGNSKYRHFCRYPEAEEDYYDTFRWLIKFAKKFPLYKVAVKHHGGDYHSSKDLKEMELIKNTPLIYLDNQLNSYRLCEQSKMIVSYASIMIVELGGYPNLAYFIREHRKRKRFLFRTPCEGETTREIKIYPPAFYLDPHCRNREFCKNMQYIVQDCGKCSNPPYLEIFEPFRLTTYEMFEKKALKILI